MATKRFQTIDAPKCFKCERTVYAAEQVIGPANKKYHKSCLVCIVCGKRLDSLSLLEHDGQPFCKLHHSQKTISHGPLYPTRDPNPLSRSVPASSTNPDGKPTLRPQRSFSKPIDLEEVRATEWAKRDFKKDLEGLNLSDRKDSGDWEEGNSNATNISDVPSIVGTEPDEEIEQVIPPDKQDTTDDFQLPFALNVRGRGDSLGITPGSGIPRSTSPAPSVTSTSARSMSSTSTRFGGGGGDMCRRCGKIVYFAEEKRAVGQKWHKMCLRCASCDKSLSSHLVEKDGLPYCNQCYSKNFGSQAQGFLMRA